MSRTEEPHEAGDVLGGIKARHPRFMAAVAADARVNSAFRGENFEYGSRLGTVRAVIHLIVRSDAFLGQVLYRAKARLQQLGVPLLPRIAHRLAMMTAQISIGDPVVVQPGIYIVHGQVVIDGIVEIGAGTVIAPWVTVGLKAGVLKGATIESNVNIGTGAKVIGPVTLGDGCVVGANAVVVADVQSGATVGGVPAAPIG